MRVEESIEIHRPLQEVFDYIPDVGNYPQCAAKLPYPNASPKSNSEVYLYPSTSRWPQGE